jgi:hypothetical protein
MLKTIKYSLNRSLYLTKIARPEVPHGNMALYQKHSLWKLRKNECSCDVEFVEYFKQQKIEQKNILHFGTGGHHIIGLENHKLMRSNQILGITASAPEHETYVNLVLKNPALAKYYKVIFADIYTLTANNLPNLDIVNLFHLCEYYLSENSALVHHDDRSLLEMFLDKLNPDGKILFYSGSAAWKKASAIVKSMEDMRKIKQVDRYKSLLIYTKALPH